MRRIILGLVFILILGGGVLGATQAFFNDTETSVGNVLTAGAVDLTVDHKYSSYNGEDCTEDCQVLEDAVNLVENGGFEEPVVTQGAQWDAFAHNTVSGWSADWVSVVGGSQPATANIELHRGVAGWLPQSGQQHAELDSDWDGPTGGISNEQALIKLYQDIPTTAGKKYELRYWHSYRPGTSASENEMKVLWDGVLVNNITDANGTGQTQTLWEEYVYEVLGDGSVIRLEFEGAGPNNSLGIFLDNVSLKEKTCSQGNQCNLWEEKDLTDSDFFWDFDDIKPGDSGRNVISLHVEDNDAWACLLMHDVEDVENVITDPEAEIGDVDDDPAVSAGELSDFINAIAWQDDDEDGIFDGGEAILGPYGNIKTVLLALSAGDPILASTTRYIGIAWCVGDMTDPGLLTMTCDGSSPANNVAQTDVMNASITAFAEQWRNNPEFVCSTDLLQI